MNSSSRRLSSNAPSSRWPTRTRLIPLTAAVLSIVWAISLLVSTQSGCGGRQRSAQPTKPVAHGNLNPASAYAHGNFNPASAYAHGNLNAYDAYAHGNLNSASAYAYAYLNPDAYAHSELLD